MTDETAIRTIVDVYFRNQTEYLQSYKNIPRPYEDGWKKRLAKIDGECRTDEQWFRILEPDEGFKFGMACFFIAAMMVYLERKKLMEVTNIVQQPEYTDWGRVQTWMTKITNRKILYRQRL